MTRFDLVSSGLARGGRTLEGAAGREVVVLVVALILYAAAIVAVAHALARE